MEDGDFCCSSFSLSDYLGLGLGGTLLDDHCDLDLQFGLSLSSLDELTESGPGPGDWEPVVTGSAGKTRESVSCVRDTPSLTSAPPQCSRCGTKFRHRKSVRRHEVTQPRCHQPGAHTTQLHFDMDQFSKTLRSELGKSPSCGSVGTEQDMDTIVPRTLHSCQVCAAVFSSQDKLQIHAEELQARLQCCHCSKRLGNRGKLATHHRSHTRHRPFQCGFCENSFTELSSLRKHTLTHGPRTHKCSRCGKAFVRPDYLRKHTSSGVCRKTH
jgi:hypothetical protein